MSRAVLELRPAMEPDARRAARRPHRPARPVVEIVNYTIPGTVEEVVYHAPADRIDLFDGLVGELQPILGAVESSFKAIYRQPRSERAQAVKAQLARRKELEKGGVSSTTAR